MGKFNVVNAIIRRGKYWGLVGVCFFFGGGGYIYAMLFSNERGEHAVGKTGPDIK
jgi:hypothetical protein